MFGIFKKKNKVNTRTKAPESIDISQHGGEMEEIFSTKEKKVRLTNTDPLTIPKQPRSSAGQSADVQQSNISNDFSITNTTSVTTIIRALDSAFDKMDSNELGSDKTEKNNGTNGIVNEPTVQESEQNHAAENAGENRNVNSIYDTSDIDFDDDFNDGDTSYSKLRMTSPLDLEDSGRSILATGKIIRGEQEEIHIAPDIPPEIPYIGVPENLQISDIPNVNVQENPQIQYIPNLSVPENIQIQGPQYEQQELNAQAVMGRTSQMLISQIENTLAQSENEAVAVSDEHIGEPKADIGMPEQPQTIYEPQATDYGDTHEFTPIKSPDDTEQSLASIVFNQHEVPAKNTGEINLSGLNNQGELKQAELNNVSTENLTPAKPAIPDKPVVSNKGDSIEQQLANNPNKYTQIYENLYSKLNNEPSESRYEKFFGPLKPVAPGTSSEAVAETTRIEKAEKDVKPETEKFRIPPFTHQSAHEYIPIVQMTTRLESVLREAYLTYSDKKEEDTHKKAKWDSSPYDFDPPQKFTITLSTKKINEALEKSRTMNEAGVPVSKTSVQGSAKNEDIADDEMADMPRFSNIPKEEPKRKRSLKLFGRDEEPSQEDEESMDKPLGMIDDFENPEDFKTVVTEININIHKLVFKTTIVLLITIVLVALAFVQRFMPDTIMSVFPKAPLMYAFFNFIALGASAFICNTTITNGLSSLLSFKANSDTILSFTCLVGVVQSVTSLFVSEDFYTGRFNLYTPIILFALLLNCIGKLIMMLRIRRNFKFVASKDEKYAAKIYNDEKKAQRLMVGIPVNKPIIAFQRKTGFLKNFLKLSYMPDPSEDMATRLTPFAILGSIAVAVAYGVITKSVIGSLSAMCVVAVLFTPVASLIAVNFPVSKLCKRALRSDAMMVGYPAVRQFSDCNAMMIDAKELYPKGSIILNGIKTFNNQKIDDAIIICSAMFKAVDNTMADIFDTMIKGNPSNMLAVDNVSYEDGDGLVGWASGDRVLIGSRHLLELHGIDVPDYDYEEKFRTGNRQVTYIAISGELVAMLILTYKADPVIAASLQRMEYNGMSFLVTTVDHNVTSERISQDFGLFYRTVKILPYDVSDYCKNAKSKYEEKSRAYVATKGSLASLGRVISGCVAIKSRLSMSIIIQIIAIILGVLTVSVLVLYSGLQHLGTIEILVYVLFWSLASIFAPQIYIDY